MNQTDRYTRERIDELVRTDERASTTLRTLLLDSPELDTPLETILDPDFDASLPIATELRELLVSLFAGMNESYGMNREYLTEIALSLSLCPNHLIDYAICFDDNDDDCAQIRMIHPLHDT